MLFFAKNATLSSPCEQGHCRGEGTNHRCSTFLVVFSVHYRVIFSTPSNKIVDSQLARRNKFLVHNSISIKKKKLINMILTFDRTCWAFFAFGELGVFHWLDACFVSGW